MRVPSRFRNQKHTVDTLWGELEKARLSGSVSEIADLELLIDNAERPKGSPMLVGVDKARNRQAVRRHGRGRVQGAIVSNATPQVGSYVRVPNGEVWLVTSVDKDTVRSDGIDPSAGFRFCHFSQATIVDGPTPASAPPPALSVATPPPAGEALYHAAWDALEGQDWAALETALRAYEVALE